MNEPIIEELNNLNNNCKFNNEIKNEYIYEVKAQNELEYNRFRKESYALSIINKDQLKWRLLVQIAEENNRIYNLYKKEVLRLKNKYSNHLTDEIYTKFKSLILKKPVTEPKIIFDVSYKSIKTGKLLTKVQEINYFRIKEYMPYALWSNERVSPNTYEQNLKNYIITKNFINKGIEQIDQLNPFEFENWLSDFMNKCGYSAFTTNRSGDYGADVIAEKDNYRIVIQCKMSKSILGIRCVQEVIGAMNYYHANDGWVVSTTPEFTYQAYNLANSANIKLYPKHKLEILLNSLIGLYQY